MKIRLSALALMASSLALLSANTSTSTPPTTAEIVAARVTRLTKLLTLTTAQATQATSIFTTDQPIAVLDCCGYEVLRVVLSVALCTFVAIT